MVAHMTRGSGGGAVEGIGGEGLEAEISSTSGRGAEANLETRR